MNRVSALCDTNRDLMLEFSELCIKRLNSHLPFRLFLTPFQPFLNANVLKEIEKDQLIIRHAAAEFGKGRPGTEIDVDGLFEETKEIDRQFLSKLSNPFFSVEIRYDDLAEIRKRRISVLAEMAFSLLSNWDDQTSFPQAVKSTFSEKGYREVLGEVLHLYNVETRILGNSASFSGPVRRAKDLFAEKLFSTMEDTARDISVEYAAGIFMGNRACPKKTRLRSGPGGSSLEQPVDRQETQEHG